MKHINITPHSVLSSILVCSILFNTSVPSVAQVARSASQKKPLISLDTNLEKQVYQTIPTDGISSHLPQRNDSLHASETRFANGSLTSAQLTRLFRIKLMFQAPSGANQVKSDFDTFKKFYTTQINEHFIQEKNSLQATQKELYKKITKNIFDWRKEVYEPLVQDQTTALLTKAEKLDKKTVSNLSKTITEDILALTINPDQSLADQITSLTKKYQNNPQAIQVINQVAQSVQTDPDQKYLYREQAIKTWQQQATQAVQNRYVQNYRALQKWQKEMNAKAKEFFDKVYGPDMLQAREEDVKNAVKDLWAYKDLAPKARYTLLKLAPMIAQLRTLDGQSFFTQPQKNWLVSQYIQTLKKATNSKQDQDADSCEFELIAMTGIGMLGNSREAANTVENFMTSQRKTACAVPSLLTGTVALLSLKQYQVLEGFLYEATREERNIKDFDLLSIENTVNVLANLNGQYLGEISKYAQYPLQANPTPDTALANAWEDVAQLLADDGSAQALALLRKYGVEKCAVDSYTTTSLKTKSKLSCAGIIPFLVGALASGKSGAEQYRLASEETKPGYAYSTRGTTYVTPKDAQENATKLAHKTKAFYQYAANMGMNNTAAVARHLFLQSMGDLNAESELLIDAKLFQAYQVATHNKTPKTEFAISPYTRNSPTYNSKRARQDRTQFFRKMGRWTDFGILVWCVVDITKWSMSGVKVARAMMKASSMARKGATVAQRAVMLRNLNITPKLRSFTNISQKIKNGMSPAVLAELPRFTSQTVELPKFPGFVESAGTLTAQSLRFSAQTGALSVDMASMTQAAENTIPAQKITALNTLAQDASLQANTQFANRSSFQRFFTWNKNASYRSYLTKQFVDLGQKRGFKLADLNPTRYLLKEGNIAVPENIASFQTPSLLENTKGLPELNMTSLSRVMSDVLGVSPSAQQLSHTQGLLETAIANTNFQFLNRNWLARQWSFLRRNNDKKYRNLLLDNLAAQFDKDAGMFANPTEFKLYQALAKNITQDKQLQVPSWTGQFRLFGSNPENDGKFHAMGSTLLKTSNPALTPQKLPLIFQMQRKRWFRFGGIKGVGSQTAAYQRVIITEKNGELTFGFGTNLEDPITPRQFKLTLAEEDIPSLLQATQNYTGAPLELKLTSTSGKWLWNPSFYSKRLTAFSQARAEGRFFPLSTLLRGKDNIYVHKIPVQIRLTDGTLQTLPITFKADSYLGLRNVSAVLEEGGNLAWYQEGKLLTQMPKFSFGLPKNQIKPLLDLTRQSALKSPLRVSGLSGKNKIEPLMWATGLSLSSASTGLIAPLENVYGDNITEGEKTLISLAFPYLPSLAAPLFSPLVMKIGALRTLQIALGVSSAGLAFTTLTGFSGKLDNHNLPPIWPLYVSGTAIGISSALSRSGLNLLIDSMGGGGTLLKSMAYKNIGSFALLLPPFAANFIDKDIDFSLAFPVLSTLSAASLTWVSTARINTSFGKKAGFMPFESLSFNKPRAWLPVLGKNIRTAWTETKKETKNTTRLLLTKEVLPLVIAATAFTGFEAGAFSKAGNQMIRPHLKNNELPGWVPETNRNNYVSMLTNLSVITFPLVARLTAKPVLKFMETGRPGDEYRHMLQASFALNATGVSLLYANGFEGYTSLGMLGIGLMGLGTANMTQSFQKLSNIGVRSSKYAYRATNGFTAANTKSLLKVMEGQTMTGFPVQQLGIAIVPTIVSSYTDKQIAEGTIQKSDASHSSLWIPVISLALCFGFSASRIGLFPTHIPAGSISLTKGLFGSYPGAVQQLQAPQFYQTKPDFGIPTGFSPIPTNPIVNMSEIIPTQKVLKKIERNLQKQSIKK